MVVILMVFINYEDMGNIGKKIGWYLLEMVYSYYVFKEVGFSMIFVSLKGGKVFLVKYLLF